MSIPIAVVLMIAIAIVSSGSTAREEDDRSRSSEIYRYARRSEEPQEYEEYVEQCRATNLLKGQLGFVNVLAFLDPSSYYSYRQAIMLKLLKARFEKSGFSNIRFFMVTPSSAPSDFVEESSVVNDIELEAWDQIYRNLLESEYFWSAEEALFDDLAKISEKDIVVLKDTPRLGIWEYFRATRDEVMILDRCGKLAYQLRVPWSILYFPYVKAAILITYKEDPCGPCNVQSISTQNSTDYENDHLRNPSPNEEGESTDGKEDDATIIPFDSSGMNNETTMSSIATTDVPLVETYLNYSDVDRVYESDGATSTENIKLDDNGSIDKMTESISKAPLREEQTQTFSTIFDAETTDGSKGLKDQLFPNKQTNANSEQENQIEKTEDAWPLRIILYAPHTHPNDQTLKKYTHTIMKTGNPDYHGHFDSKNVVYDQQPIALERSDATVLKNKKVIEYGPDESPGVFGEIADYFRIPEDDSVNYDDVVVDETQGNNNDDFNSESNTLKSSDIDTTDSDMQITVIEDLENSAQQRIIKHYNKLLSWIYYVL